MHKEEVWSVSIRRASSFFREQKDVTVIDDTTFQFGSCRIVLTELPPKGAWAIARIQLLMDGDDADVNVIYRRFMIQFLTTGG